LVSPDPQDKGLIYRTLTYDPKEMARRGRIGAYRLHATHDPKETTKAAREAFMARFEREVDPDGTLAPEERARRAEAARKAYFAQLAHKSAKARRRRPQKAKDGAAHV
jgi:hypothetical protein